MEVVWRRGSASADDVRTALARRHPMKESTARTVLKRLEEKGYVLRSVEGRTYIYRGAEAPVGVAARAVRQVIDRFCGGSFETLLVGMVDHQVVDEEELQRLVRLIANRRGKEK